MNFKKVVKNIMDNENLKSKLESLQSFEEVYKFFLSNGYEGTKQELKENLFGSSETTYAVPDKELDQVAGGASGRKALAACAGVMMMLGITPMGLNGQSSAKATFFNDILPLVKTGKKDTKNQGSQDYDADNAEKHLRHTFENYFQNQQDVEDQIISFVKQYAEERETCLPAPRTLIFNGPDKAAKTAIAESLSQSITSINPFMISASDILKSSNGDPDFIPYVFFNGCAQRERNLVSFLKKTEGSVRVVIVDEWDKIYRKDVHGNYPETHPLDETMRSIVSNRITDDIGDRVDLNGAVFIFTSNESEASLQGRIKVEPKTGKLVEAIFDDYGYPVLNENGEQVYRDPKTNGQGQTLAPHDPSLMEHLRIFRHVFYFKDDNE